MAISGAPGSLAGHLPTQEEFDAHHEAAHALLIHIWAWPHLGISRQLRPDGNVDWITSYNLFGTYRLQIDPNVPYEELGLPRPTGTVEPAAQAIQYCAGRIAELLLAEQAGMSLAGEWKGYDAEKAREIAENLSKDQAEEIIARWKILTRQILSHHACWYTVQQLAGELLQKPDLSGEEVQENISRALATWVATNRTP